MQARKIDGFHGRYTIYEDGRIFKKKGNDNRCSGHFIKHKYNNRGYAVIDIVCDKKRKAFLLHRLLAIYFIPNPLNKETVNHKDGNKSNNKLSNLEWATYKENNDHSRYVLGNKHIGKGRKQIINKGG